MILPGEPLADLVSSDPKVCEHYKNDPRNHGFVSTAFYFSYLDRKNDSFEKADSVTYPTMVQIAGSDQIIDPKSIERFSDRLPSSHRCHTYQKMYHEIYNEPDRQQVFNDLIEWIEVNSAT